MRITARPVGNEVKWVRPRPPWEAVEIGVRRLTDYGKYLIAISQPAGAQAGDVLKHYLGAFARGVRADGVTMPPIVVGWRGMTAGLVAELLDVEVSGASDEDEIPARPEYVELLLGLSQELLDAVNDALRELDQEHAAKKNSSSKQPRDSSSRSE